MPIGKMESERVSTDVVEIILGLYGRRNLDVSRPSSIDAIVEKKMQSPTTTSTFACNDQENLLNYSIPTVTRQYNEDQHHPILFSHLLCLLGSSELPKRAAFVDSELRLRELRGFLKGRKGTGSYVIEFDGDNGAATKDDDMEWVEELMTCLGLTPKNSITLFQTEDLSYIRPGKATWS
jgi:hypothetical protein